MLSRFIISLSLFSILISTVLAQPQPNPGNTCMTILKQIESDNNKYGLSLRQQNLPWMDLGWLNLQLRTPITSTVNQIYYKWNDYMAFDDGSGNIATFGTLPNNQTNPDKLTQIIKILGQPIQTLIDPMTQYKWLCPDGSKISVIAKNNTIMTIDITSNASFTAIALNFGLAGSAFNNRQIMPATPEQTKTAATAVFNSYNQHFQTTINSQNDLNAAVLVKLKNYYANLRICRAGTYLFAKPVANALVFPKAVVSGLKNGVCRVEMTYQTQSSGVMDVRCKFSTYSMQLFTDKQAEIDALGGVNINPGNPTLMQQVLTSECKSLPNAGQ